MVNCKLNQIFLGEVASVQNYGAFIRIPNCSTQGLIHKSQVSSARVDDVTEILQKGEQVWCKIISIGNDGKIGLSMKYVNQGNGTDLDPNGIELQRDIQKRKGIQRHEHKVIVLEAVLNTTCTKCGTTGHLSKDCFMSPHGKRYELIPEIKDDAMVQLQTTVNKQQTKHKEKKLKKKKKAKKLKQNINDSDSDRKETTKKENSKYSRDRKKKEKHGNSIDKSFNENISSHDVKTHKRKHLESTDKHYKRHKHSKSKHSNS